MPDDIEIVKQCQAGQMENFGLLYDKYISKIYNFVYFKNHHKETTEDLVSIIFVKAVKNIKKFNLETGTFQAWLYQIARNTVIDYYRTSKKDVNIEDVWDLSSDESIERDIDTKQKLERVEKYISNLKSEQRDILIMKIWQDMSYSEIAQVLGKSEASCKMSLSRTLKQLRETMPVDALLVLLLLGRLVV